MRGTTAAIKSRSRPAPSGPKKSHSRACRRSARRRRAPSTLISSEDLAVCSSRAGEFVACEVVCGKLSSLSTQSGSGPEERQVKTHPRIRVKMIEERHAFDYNSNRSALSNGANTKEGRTREKKGEHKVRPYGAFRNDIFQNP